MIFPMLLSAKGPKPGHTVLVSLLTKITIYNFYIRTVLFDIKICL